ncbi:ATP-dependent zinc protease [Ferrimonas balearica]|uniref:ATP-dependent zinc protease family protein n=1 Tax=Ferrimonas balearica TaxID=44012 RepID=UPI0021BDDC83|nr:ATP-dependent zinc protease [Ferrimonas balearica]
MKHTGSLLLAAATLAVTGCAQKPVPATEQQLTNAMATQLAQIETMLIKRCDSEVAANHEYQTQVVNELSGMNVGLLALAEQAAQQPVICPEVEVDPHNLGDKIVLGEVERVFVQEVGDAFDARVDTGAVSSSISATNIRLFERNGDQWVRFDIPSAQPAEGEEAAPADTVEARVSRFVSIKKASSEEPQRRPVIRARVKLGDYVTETDLNLADRSHMEYPVLLGRQFFQDIAVVDVSRKYIHSGDANGAKPTE